MQPAQLDKLKQLIATSPLLQSAERAHWLDLLPLMNDKQISDLEGILQPQPGKFPLDITEKELSAGTPVRGDHLLASPTVSKPRVVRPTVSAPAPRFAPAFPKFSHLQNGPPLSIATKPEPAKPQLKFTPTPPPPAAKILVDHPTEQVVSSSSHAVAIPTTVADVVKISKETLHKAGLSALMQALQNLVRKANYFEVLFALEKSPLFGSYIRTGQRLLEENSALDRSNAPAARVDSDTGQLLSRDDFEAVADLLRSIQVN